MTEHRPWTPRLATRSARIEASEIRELLKLVDRPDVISFAGGLPDPALFPLGRIRAAYGAALADDRQAGRLLQYSVSEGDAGLRRWIAGLMARKGVTCGIDNILITNGAQQALEFIGRLFLSPADTALVSAPTYLGALQAFATAEPVFDQLGQAGANRTPESYRQAAAEAAQGGEVKLAYAVPDFANPTGETMTRAARGALLDLAETLDIAVIEDAAYTELGFESLPPPPLQALDVAARGSIEASRVLYCGTFSKVFTPGLRIGWICGAREVVRRLTLIKQASDLNVSAMNQHLVATLAETAFDEQVARARIHYRAKRDAMLAALAAHMPEGVAWTRPGGGMFLWLTLPDDIDATSLLHRAVREAGVAFVPGRSFFADARGVSTLRLSYSLPDPAQIETGIARLGEVLGREMSLRR